MLLSKEPLNNAALSCSRRIYRRKLYWYIPLNSGCTELGVHIHCAWRFSLQSISIRHTPRSRSVLSDAIPESYRLSSIWLLRCNCGLSTVTVYYSIFFLSILFSHILKKLHFRQIAITHIVQIALSYECNHFHHSRKPLNHAALSYWSCSRRIYRLIFGLV